MGPRYRLVHSSSWLNGWELRHGRAWGGNRAAQAALPGPSTFSLFRAGFIEEPERKYCFECDSEEQCREWIEALKRARWAEPLIRALRSALCCLFSGLSLWGTREGERLSPPEQTSLQL